MTTKNSNITESHLYEIAKRLELGHASIMIGAGFSKNASSEFPLWEDLGIEFYKNLNDGKLPKDSEHFLNPMKLAGQIEEGLGKNKLIEVLKSKIPDKKYAPSELHVKLLSLPWNDVFTTNYDTLLERASEQVVNYRYDIVKSKKELPYSQRPRIIKLHGCLKNVKDIVITDDDYLKYPEKQTAFVNTVLQSLTENTLCLLGFSGEDPNFLSWLNWIINNLGIQNSPKIYLVGKFDMPSPQEKWLKKRNIIVVNLNDLGELKEQNHAEAISYFLNYLSSILQKNNKLNWPNKLRLFSGIGNEQIIKNMLSIISHWQKDRIDFPNWLIVPEKNREKLWTETIQWIRVVPRVIDLLEPNDFEFLYEINWRLDKCLYPIENDLITYYQLIIEKYSPNNEKLEIPDFEFKWFELRLSMLRYFREEALLDHGKILTNKSQFFKRNYLVNKKLNGIMKKFYIHFRNWTSEMA